MTTRTAIVAQQGGDLEDTFRTLAREEKVAKKHGITLPENMPKDPAASAANPKPKEEAEPVP